MEAGKVPGQMPSQVLLSQLRKRRQCAMSCCKAKSVPICADRINPLADGKIVQHLRKHPVHKDDGFADVFPVITASQAKGRQANKLQAQATVNSQPEQGESSATGAARGRDGRTSTERTPPPRESKSPSTTPGGTRRR